MLVVITPFASTPAGARLRVLYINNDDSIVVEGNIVVDPDYVLPLVPPKHRLLMDCATPVQGWDAFLRDAGVSLKLYGNTGAQFFAEFWGGVGSGKTGGLHMSEVGTCMRRCQLSVEHGVEGQSLRHSVAGTKAGLLIYVGPTLPQKWRRLALHRWKPVLACLSLPCCSCTLRWCHWFVDVCTHK